VVVLANEGFVTDGRSAASSKGMPGLRIVPETVPCECTVQGDADAGIGPVMEEIVHGFTRPLSDEERAPKSKEKAHPARIVFKGDLAEVNRFFYKSGWSDGLPLVPPTEEAVQEMLTGTDLPPDHMIGKVQPRLGKATVEKIAINAVMAGALPTHLPVLLAGVEHVLDPNTRFGTFSMSTGSWAPFWVINGPIRNDIHVNSSSGSMSPGNIANSAIGRAMGLIIKNLGGIRKSVEDMGVIGNPCKYSMVIGENEESSPWAPLHVDEGFEQNDNTVSLIFPNSFSQTWPYASDDRGILASIANGGTPYSCRRRYPGGLSAPAFDGCGRWRAGGDYGPTRAASARAGGLST
jgi:hypothetical protein